MTALIPFVFEEQLVRAVERHGVPWFVGKDVCHCLGLKNTNDALGGLDNDEKGVATTDPLAPGGEQTVIVISEPGVYRLVFRSRKPEAERFKRWLAHEVLPKLRRDGAFDAIHAYCRWVRWTASWMVGLRSELRGEVPTDAVIVASKHQSFFDIILIVSETPRPKFIMKKELLWAPFVGQYALLIGCVPVDRGKRGHAIKQMLDGVRNSRTSNPVQAAAMPRPSPVVTAVPQPTKYSSRETSAVR